jgi:hypothetical protein
MSMAFLNTLAPTCSRTEASQRMCHALRCSGGTQTGKGRSMTEIRSGNTALGYATGAATMGALGAGAGVALALEKFSSVPTSRAAGIGMVAGVLMGVASAGLMQGSHERAAVISTAPLALGAVGGGIGGAALGAMRMSGGGVFGRIAGGVGGAALGAFAGSLAGSLPTAALATTGMVLGSLGGTEDDVMR